MLINDVAIAYRVLQKLQNWKTKVKHTVLIYLEWSSRKGNSMFV